MISFKIVKSVDFEITNQTYTFFHNLLYIGHAQGHFFIKDPLVLNNHIMLEVIENDLYIHPNANVEFYLIDGKRSTSIKKIKSGQILTIGKSDIKILSYGHTESILRKDILDTKLKYLVDQQDRRLSVIEEISGLIK